MLIRKKFENPPLTEKEKKLLKIYMVTLFVSFVYPVFLPLKLGTVWFYVGFFVCLLGMTCTITALADFETTPVDKPVTKGIYSISRNPQFLGVFLALIGVGIACASWLFLLLTMIMITSRAAQQQGFYQILPF